MIKRSRARSHHPSRTRIKLTADQIRVTNEEILGDLLYPAPAHRASRPGRPGARR